MKRGDICLATFPFTDHTGSKVRPVLIVDAGDVQDIIAVPISSNPAPGDPRAYFIDQSSSDFAATRLRGPSSIKWSKPMTISRSVLRKRLGELKGAALQDVLSEMSRMFAPAPPPTPPSAAGP
jgi:mRNA interferase MazF